jgi:hypothetical protein
MPVLRETQSDIFQSLSKPSAENGFINMRFLSLAQFLKHSFITSFSFLAELDLAALAVQVEELN